MNRNSNVRKSTKIKRSIKAISPVIATLLMIAIAVVASLVAYAWVMGYMGTTTTKAGRAIDIPSFASAGGGNLVIYVQNVGQGPVTLSKSGSIYINDQGIDISSITDKLTINEGQTQALTVSYPSWSPGQQIRIKVVTTDGTFMQTSGAGTSVSQTAPPTQYSVDFVMSTGGLTISPTAGAHAVGGTIAVSATPNTDYVFNQWQSTGSITFANANSASTTATISGAGTITATFTYSPAGQYSVTFDYGAGGASVTPSGTQSYVPAASVPITATAASGNHFTLWTSTGSITFDAAASASTNAHINGAGTITANFAANTVVQYDVVVTQSANGVIAPGTTSYDAGSTPSFTITPSAGYHIASVTTNAGAQALVSPYVFPALSADETLTATFAADTVQYSVSFSLGTGGQSMTPTVTQLYDAGASVPLTATAASGYHFTSWTSDAGSITFDSAASSSTNAHIGAAGTITANFAANTPITITLRPNAAGSTTECSRSGSGGANWDRVDDTTADEGATYVYGTSETNRQTDTYNIADQSLSGTISNVRIYIRALETVSRTDVYAWTAIRIGTGSIQYGAQIDTTTSWANYYTNYATKTGNLGSGAWSWTDINSLQIGVGLQSNFGSSNRYAECTQVWVEITYTPA